MECMNCSALIGGSAKERRSVNVKIYRTVPQITVAEALKEIYNIEDLSVTPVKKTSVGERSLCIGCFQLLGAVSRNKQNFQKALREFENAGSCDSGFIHVSKKSKSVLSPFHTPSKAKNLFHKYTGISPSASPQRHKSTGKSFTKRALATPSPFSARKKIKFPDIPRSTKKRKLLLDTPEKEVPQVEQQITFTEQAQQQIGRGNYGAALGTMYQFSSRAKLQVRSKIRTITRKELQDLDRSGKYVKEEFSLDSLKKFKWNNIMTELQQKAPTLVEVIKSSISTERKHVRDLSWSDTGFGSMVPSLGFILLTILHLRHPRKYNFLQNLNSSLIFMNGNSHKLLNIFSHLGLSHGKTATRNTVDRIRKHYDYQAKEMKKEVEDSHRTFSPSMHSLLVMPGDLDSDSEWEDAGSTCSESSGQSGEPGADEDDELQCVESSPPLIVDASPRLIIEIHPGYVFVWDNVQKLMLVKHMTSDKQNIMQLWAMSLMVKNRISYKGGETATCSASSIPYDKYVLSDGEWDAVDKYLAVLVERILVLYFSFFKETCQHAIVRHINHQHTKESSRKSEIVNLGVVEANPATTKGVADVMKHLNAYVPYPHGAEGNPVPILCTGDQLSAERMVSARVAMAESRLPSRTLKGLEPCAQEFHHRCLILQDTINQLYTANSGQERGTLYNIKAKFSYKNIKPKVMDNVQKVDDLLEFTTEGLTCLVAMELLGLKNLSDIPKDAPNDRKDNNELKQYLNRISAKIVQFIKPKVEFKRLDVTDSEDTQTEYSGTYCNCQTTLEDLDVMSAEIVQCAAGLLCAKQRWYHLECLDLKADELPEEWWCHQECEQFTTYCCHQTKDSEWVGCSNAKRCKGKEWYHLECVGLEVVPRGKWFCSNCKQKARKTKNKRQSENRDCPTLDHRLEYMKSLCWQGLVNKLRKDIECENNGPMMVTMWKHDVVPFWENNHYKYLILGHRLVSSVNGWVEERLSNDIIWNRTANKWGTPGHNVALDLVCEHSNNDFKAFLRHSHGQYSIQHVQRVSHMVGSFGKEIQEVCSAGMIGTDMVSKRRSKRAFEKDIPDFVRVYKRDKLYSEQVGREFEAFPGFIHHYNISKHAELQTRYEKYAWKLDAEKLVMDVHN